MNLKPIPFQCVKVDSPIWSPRIQKIREVTVPSCLDQCEKSGRLDNFRITAGMKEGSFKGIFFDDSDVYKVIEGAAYCLGNEKDEALEQRVDAVIQDICAAQQSDGYIYNYFSLQTPEKRWTDMDMHEDYCLGHMTEAAIAYAQATGKTALLECAIRGIEHMMSIFGPGKRHWVTGHQELKLALVKLYRYTGETKYLDFAEWLVSERGNGHFESERQKTVHHLSNEYYQDAVPFEKLERVTGHAVRAMYYFTGVSDLISVRDNTEWRDTLERIWNNVYPANMYVTGGIGQSSDNEGFTRDYHKPCLTAYCETCASIGMAIWNHRMNLLSGSRKYADLVETEMYNGVPAGISLNGDRFFYDNPLSSIGKHHRVPWFSCSCCPTNLCRFIPSIGGYAYSADDSAIWINQFVGGKLSYAEDGKRIEMNVTTDYPRSGVVRIDVVDCTGFDQLIIRVPGWCENWSLSTDAKLKGNGYLSVDIAQGMNLIYQMDMPVRRFRDDPRVAETLGRVCFCRGPVVYCAEEVDNPGIMPSEYFHSDLSVSSDAIPKESGILDELSGTVKITVDNLTLIPYALWDNRAPGAMTVWIKEK